MPSLDKLIAKEQITRCYPSSFSTNIRTEAVLKFLMKKHNITNRSEMIRLIIEAAHSENNDTAPTVPP